MLFNSQRGALFGLDARIALAIVGGMSAITGVSMMQSSVGARAGALEQELANISEIVSNSQEVWGHSPNFFLKAVHKENLVNNSEEAANAAYAFMDDSVLETRPPQWVGPYFTRLKTRSISATKKEVYSTDYGTFYLYRKKDTAGVSTSNLLPTACASNDRSNCYYWFMYKTVPVAIAKHLDKQLDDNNQLTGSIRYGAPSSGKTFLHYQGPRVLP